MTGRARPQLRRGLRAAAAAASVIVALGLAAAWQFPGPRTALADAYWELVLALRLVRPDRYVGPHFWAVALHPDGGQIAAAGMYPEPLVWELPSLLRRPAPTRHDTWVMELGWSPDGRWFVSSDFDGGLRLRELATGRELAPPAAADAAYSFAFRPGRDELAWGAYDGRVRILDLRSGAELHSIPANAGGVLFVAYAPDGRLLSAGEDGQVRFFDPDSGAELQRWIAHAAGITSLSFSPDGRFAVSGGDDAQVRLWDYPSGGLLREESPHPGWVNFVSFLADGRYVSVGTSDSLFVWDPADLGAPPRAVPVGSWGMCVRPLPDGSGFVSSGKDGIIRIWDGATLTVRKEIQAFEAVRRGGFRMPAL